MSIIKDEEFRLAKNNPDNKKILLSILNKYRYCFTAEELEAIGDIALWNCLRGHNNKFGQKFTTSLYTFATWQVLIECRKLSKKRSKPSNVGGYVCPSGLIDKQNDIERVDLYDAIDNLPEKYQDVIYEYYFENMTLSEIGTKHDVSIETARKRIQQGLISLKKQCS